jgi:ribonuclease H2 subunit A
MGFMDSKQLTEAKRDDLWERLQTCGFIGWRIRVLEAAEISEGMLRRHSKYNLNAMSHDAAIGLVQEVIDLGVNLRYLYVDTVGDPGRYQEKLSNLFPTLKVTVEKKADATYPVVSAASICAKVPRDTLLNEWKFEDPRICNDRDWGCGYPSDVNTKRWMKDNLQPTFGWPDLVRFSWGPAKEVMDKEPEVHGAHVVRWPPEEGEEGTSQQRDSMAAFLSSASKRQKVERHRLLHEAGLEPVASW